MDVISAGIAQAFRLIVSGDPEIVGIIGLSLFVSFSSVIISTCLGMPVGILLGTHSFRGKGVLLRIIYTFMSLDRKSVV